METKVLTEELKTKVAELHKAARDADINLFVMAAGNNKDDNTQTETITAANGKPNEIIAGLMKAIEDDDTYFQLIAISARLAAEERKRKMTRN